MKTDLELLKEYLQSEIDCGNHKLFIFDENNNATELKTIDGFNAITNLQQENEDLKNRLENTVADCNLRLQENETLKAKLEMGKTCAFCPYYDYKSRCKNAIEYIKMCKCDYSPYELTDSETRIILNILNGSVENETNS